MRLHSEDASELHFDPNWSTRLLVLRASHASSVIGSSDIRVWSELDARKFECVLLLQSRRKSSESRRKNVHTVVSFIPWIPLLSWLLLNLIIALRFSRARFDLIVFTPRTWLAACILRGLGVSHRWIMDARSGLVHRWRLLMLLEYAELKVALAFSRSDGLTFLNERTKAFLIPESLELPVGIWGSGVDLDLFKRSEKGRVTIRSQLGPKDANVVMYHGSITEDRGVFQLIRAMEVLGERDVSANLTIGSPSLRSWSSLAPWRPQGFCSSRGGGKADGSSRYALTFASKAERLSPKKSRCEDVLRNA